MSNSSYLSGRAGMREQDIQAQFRAGNRTDADSFDAAMSEARTRPSRSAVFRSNGREFVLLQSLDDDLWHYRPMRAERSRASR
jgi:hypothetical protein